ncbi:MAG: PBSX family phage terminase large subunit, partial [Pseudomonadota bacterium]|nr:PBSX family phage terminase large subunit [Pseudomonadota bacterium]
MEETGPEIDIPEAAFLPCYQHLLNSETDIDLLWGGRYSGKSHFKAQQLIIDCLQKDYFRCILIKKTAESIKDSQWQAIKDVVESWGLQHLFDFKISPLEIRCKNGNKFIARGCDNPGKIKSVTNPSDAWYEEGNQLTRADYITVSTTLRSNKGKVREHITFNPECEGNYEDFWIYQMFFENHYPRGVYNFADKIEFKVNDAIVSKTFSSTHTTYQVNPFIKADQIARLEELKRIDPYYYKVYAEGLWGKKQAGGEALKCFKSEYHVGFAPYRKDLALHLAFDENVVPYFPCGVFQIENKNIYMVDEIAAYHPNNKVTSMCNEIRRRFIGHNAGMFIYGDATSQKEDVKQQYGHDLFRLLMDGLTDFKPVRRVGVSNPSVVMSLNFLNTIFETNYNGLTFLMDEKCKTARTDFENAKEAPDGGIDKKKVTDKETGQS